jgi:hypothetical protein
MLVLSGGFLRNPQERATCSHFQDLNTLFPEEPFFCHVTSACRGVVFHSVEIAMKYMAQATTTTGLRTVVSLLEGEYPTGEKAPKDYKKTMRIEFDEELPAWNYRAVPVKQGS